MQNHTPAEEPGTDSRCAELIAAYDEDGPTVHECGARVHHTDRGYSCARGHAYTYALCREAEGWDYASDPVEAALLAQAGVTGVRPGDGVPWL